MNKKIAQLHTARTMSTHVLNLRGVRTAHEQRLEEARKRLRAHTQRRRTQGPVATQHQSQESRQPIKQKSSDGYTLVLSPFKALTLLLTLSIGLVSTYVVGPTIAYYDDPETSGGNVFAAGVVDFVLETTPFDGMATATPEGDVEGWEVAVVPHAVSNPFYYYASSTTFHGSLELCEVITVAASVDGQVMFEGPLTELVTGTTTVIDTWSFSFSGAVGFPGETCHFDVDFNGWQTRHGIVEGGYSDTETANFWITDPSVILSKVHFAQTDGGDTLLHEWVEVYNPSNIPIDISGWSICDNEQCDVIPTTTPIAPDTFGLIVPDVAVLNQISVPNDITVMVVSDGAIGDGLSVDADMLQLRTLRGFVADQMNWGDPSVLWMHHSDSLWMPGVHSTTTPDVFARVPVEVDTNAPHDFTPLWRPAVALLAPTVNAAWEAGSTQSIQWIATNPNGDDDDLRVDLYHIDAQGGETLIIFDTENDGSHNWMVPSAVGESLQIKLVVTSPENVLLNTVAFSDTVTTVCGENSTSSDCVGLTFLFEKKFSGDDLGFTEDQFSFHIVGDGFDRVVPHEVPVLLSVGDYVVTEIVPDDFYIPDWRIQWSGDTCTGDNVAGGQAFITVEERDLRKITSYCRADNQFRPEWRLRSDGTPRDVPLPNPAVTSEATTTLEVTEDDEAEISTELASSTELSIDTDSATSTEELTVEIQPDSEEGDDFDIEEVQVVVEDADNEELEESAPVQEIVTEEEEGGQETAEIEEEGDVEEAEETEVHEEEVSEEEVGE